MNVLIVSFYYFPELGAAPARITNMAEGLKSEGVDVDVLTCLPNYPKGEIFDGYKHRFSKHEEINGVNVYRYWTYATVSKSALKRGVSMIAFASTLWSFALRRSLIKKYDYVLVQCPPLPVAVSALTLFKKLFKKKVLINISDLWPLSAVELGAMREGSKIHSAFSWMEKFVYRNADGILGQSNEILAHIGNFPSPDRKLLYRNVKPVGDQTAVHHRGEQFKIVYAGLLGVAQDILGLIRNIDFTAIGTQFHIYGGGNQVEAIKEYIAENPTCGVTYHGYVSKEELASELVKYDASIVPLTVNIRGAVPSKIFDLLPVGIPILFCGGGEGARIVNDYSLGLASTPADYKALQSNILKLKNMPADEYERLSANCIKSAQQEFNLKTQIDKLITFLNN